MSWPPTSPVAPPGWHYQPALGRWLWWDGYRWIDPGGQPAGPPPFTGSVDDGSATPSGWWPPLEPIGFGAAVVSIAFLVVMFVAQFWIADADPNSLAVGLAGLAILAASVFGMPAVALVAAHKFGTRGVINSIGLRFRWIDLPLSFPTAFAMMFMLIVINVLWAAFGGATGSNLEDLKHGGASTAMFAFMFVLAGIVAPITEELLFRGALFRGLLSRMGLWPALVLQGLIFGSMHYTPGQGWGNVNLILSLSVMGVGLGLLTKLTGRLGLAIGAHAVFNITQLSLLWLSLQ